MAIERVSTNGLAQAMLAQVLRASNQLNDTQSQIASGKLATDYAGFGNKTSVMEAARAAQGRMEAYQASTQLALNQTDLQNTHISSLAGLADQLRQAMTKAVADGDASTLMSEAQSIFDQAAQILNSRDSNGNYLYGGEKDNTAPFTATSLSNLAGMPSVSNAFANGSQQKTIMVGDGESVQVGVLASDVGTDLMQMLKDIASFDAGPSGNFSGSTVITAAQSSFLSNSLPQIINAASNLNTAAATNGYAYNRLQDALDRQTAMGTMYEGFVGNLESVDMGEAVTRLNQNQVALQAALQIASQMNRLSLLNFMQ
jgi:flagellar hook-associated protein 3 FlgL